MYLFFIPAIFLRFRGVLSNEEVGLNMLAEEAEATGQGGNPEREKHIIIRLKLRQSTRVHKHYHRAPAARPSTYLETAEGAAREKEKRLLKDQNAYINPPPFIYTHHDQNQDKGYPRSH